MRHTRTARVLWGAVLLVCVLAALAGCGKQAPSVEPEVFEGAIPLTRNLTDNDIADAIIRGATVGKWSIAPEGERSFTGRSQHRAYWIEVTITHDDTRYWITFKDGGLTASEEQTVHPRYNAYVGKLNWLIQRELAGLGKAKKP